MFILKRGFKKELGLPYDRHSNLLIILSDSLPRFDLICHSSVNFLSNCVSSDSLVVNFMSFHGTFLDGLSHQWDETSYIVVSGITFKYLILFILIITSLCADIIILSMMI